MKRLSIAQRATSARLCRAFLAATWLLYLDVIAVWRTFPPNAPSAGPLVCCGFAHSPEWRTSLPAANRCLGRPDHHLRANGAAHCRPEENFRWQTSLQTLSLHCGGEKIREGEKAAKVRDAD